MTNQELIDAVKAHQSNQYLHPLTCGVDSRHEILVAKEIDGNIPDLPDLRMGTGLHAFVPDNEASGDQPLNTSKVLEATGSVLIVIATVMASMGMPLMFVPFMLANLCWMAFSYLYGFRYMFALNFVLFAINTVGVIRSI